MTKTSTTATPPNSSKNEGEGNAERRNFNVHPAIIWSLVHNQAVGLSKALQELAQNAVDAGASKCEITMSPTSIVVTDDGKGFASRSEIENFFETFGTPHEEGDATYGRFRMGRGQIMAYGSQRWKTSQFRLVVDLKAQAKSKNKGLQYDLITLDDYHQGCHIDIGLYDELKPSEIDQTEREIRNHLKYLQIPLIFNGEQISKLPKDCEWDFDDDVAYYSLRDTGHLSVYNLGVWVANYPASTYGCGGTVVSKVPLDVIFSRAGIASSCKVFKKITAKVRATTVDKTVRKSKLNDAEWEALANSIRVGTKPLAEIMDAKLLRNSNGAMFSLADLGSKLDRANDRIAIAKAKDMVADRILQRGVALVLDQEVLAKFGYGSLREFKTDIAKKAGREAKRIHDWKIRNPLVLLEQALNDAKILEAKDFGKYVKADYEEVPLKELSPAEKFALKVFSRGCYNIGWEISRVYQAGSDLGEELEYEWQRRDRERTLESYPASVCEMMVDMAGGKEATPRARELKVGLSQAAAAWTDGEHTIWLNRHHLKDLTKGLSGCAKIASLMLHEYCHQSPNLGAANEHSPEFYELFHELSVHTPIIGRAVDKMMETAVKLVRDEKRKPTGALKKFEDQKAQVLEPVFVANDQPELELVEEALSPGLAP
jgi:hypothetical protein